MGRWVSEQVIMSTNQGGSVVPDGVHALMLQISWIEIARKSRACFGQNTHLQSVNHTHITLAGYSPWKLPPEIVSFLFARTIY